MAASIEEKTLLTVYSQNIFMFDPHHSAYLVHKDEQIYTPDPCLVSSEDLAKDGTPAPIFPPVSILRVTTDCLPRDTLHGFTFGSNADQCDILLDNDHRRGISNRQFSIKPDLSTPGIFHFQNHSQHATKILIGDTAQVVKSTRCIPGDTQIHVLLGHFDLQIRVPSHKSHWPAFLENWAAFVTKDKSLPPDLQHLGLGSMLRTSRAPSKTGSCHRGPKIGHGASGNVYRESSRDTGLVYAVKYYHPGRPDEEIHEEARLLGGLSHKHIVHFIELLAKPRALVLEYVGVTLEEENIVRRLAPLELREVLKQLLEALSYVHHHDIIHRDVKPASVLMLSRDPVYVKLGGFNTAMTPICRRDRTTTALYAAPEMFDEGDEVEITERIDIWSLGILALQFSDGIPPCVQRKKDPFWWFALRCCLSTRRLTHFIVVVQNWLEYQPEKRFPAIFSRNCLPYFTLPPELLFDGSNVLDVPDHDDSLYPENRVEESIPDTASFERPDTPNVLAPSEDEPSECSQDEEYRETSFNAYSQVRDWLPDAQESCFEIYSSPEVESSSDVEVLELSPGSEHL
ncbi:Cyclin-dependent kinase-like 1 [Colletotrichum fructicola]|nr:Cyclin-dependent kinase-like 1 [Colletotrichum fructicola]